MTETIPASAVPDGFHKCPGPGLVHASLLVADDMLACSRHWYQVPADIRARVWREYRREPGSKAHMAAIIDAVNAMSELPRAKAKT